jgi:hypothetical protein
MHILFLDESGKPSDRTFAVGGVAVAADRWADLRARWEGALTAYGWPAEREAKWHGIRTGEVPPALADALFAALCGSPITCFVVVLRPLAGRKQNDGCSRRTRTRTRLRSPSSLSDSNASLLTRTAMASW